MSAPGAPSSSGTGTSEARLARGLLGLLVLLLGIFYAWNILGRRLPRHDSLTLSYVLQYLFLVQSSQGGGIPLWLPFSTHGNLTSWYAGMGGGGILHAALVLVGVKEGTNALPLFHLGLLLDEILLLLGTWSLGRFFFRSLAARFFVTATVLGSTFWAEQIWHNHRAVYALPMIWSLFHGFLEDRGRGKLFLALNLLGLQFVGSIPYTAAMTIAVAAGYMAVYLGVFRRRLRGFWSALRPRPVDALILVWTAALLGCTAVTLKAGTGEAILQQAGRDATGRVTLEQFLTFARTLDPIRYLDLVLGISPMRDFTLFFGVATVPLALLGLYLRPGRSALHLAAVAAGAFLLSLGYLSLVGMLAYYAVPPLRYYRYISMAGAHVRIPLIFLAGLGVEGLARTRPAGRIVPASFGRALAALSVLSGGAALAYLRGVELPLDLPRIVQTPVPQLGTSEGFDHPGLLAGLLGGTCVSALALGAVAGALRRRPSWTPGLVAALVAVQVADLAWWRVELTVHRTEALTEAQYALQAIRPLPFIRRRSAAAVDAPDLRPLPAAFFEKGAAYDVDDTFLHRDPPASPFTVPFWMSSLDRLLRAYGRQPLDGPVPVVPAVWRGDPPRVRPPYDKVMGLAADKLQVFRTAHAVGEDRLLAELMNRPEFRGDVLLVAPAAGGAPGADPPPLRLQADERVGAPIEVRSFDANRLRVEVRLPAGSPGAWLLYCDAWHSDWEAAVNGKPRPVLRAFLAYKAVALDPGTNRVEFRLSSPSRQWAFRFLAANAAGWVAGTVLLLAAGLAGWSGGPWRKGPRRDRPPAVPGQAHGVE